MDYVRTTFKDGKFETTNLLSRENILNACRRKYPNETFGDEAMITIHLYTVWVGARFPIDKDEVVAFVEMER